MKTFFILCVIALSSREIYSQTLITYGNNTISKAEFLRAYNKNKPATADREKAMQEYLELYTDFKLKVKAAEELRLDTISQIRYDIRSFREQVIENYLSNEKDLQFLVDEAAARSQKDLHVLYFLIPVSSGATPADTLKAYTAARELYNILRQGTADHANAVTEISTKIYPVKYSDIGFITAFSATYELENIIYSTKPGTVSEPYRSAKGWSLFKVTEERPAVGKWKAAQLLFAYPPDADYNTKLTVKQKADSVYMLIRNGLSFGEAAGIYSDDRFTAAAGGELPEFTTGKYNAVFENNVFSLKNDNDITKPFESALGYHIVKRLGLTPFPADKNEAAYQFEIKQKVMQDNRINAGKEKFAKEIILKTGFKKSGEVSDADFYRYADTLMKNPTVENTEALPLSRKVVISFKDGTKIKGNEWLKFVREYNSNPGQKRLSNRELSEKFYTTAATDYYKKHLEVYSNDFKYQMQEFKEGNMLFEIMERNVWSKAGADSAGLITLYNANRNNYKWTASADVLIFNCSDEKTATEVRTAAEAGKKWVIIAENSNNRVQADSGRYELAQVPGAELINNPKSGTFSPFINNPDNTVVFLKFIKIYDTGMQRSFSEARGLVINDYQNVLERRWVQALRKKYPVSVNDALFKQMLK